MKLFRHTEKRIEAGPVTGAGRDPLPGLLWRQIGLTLVLIFTVTPAARSQVVASQDRLEQAATMIRDRRLAEAERELNSILGRTPNDAAALNLLGTIRAQEGKLSEAETLFTRAAKIDPSLVPVHMNLAFLYLIINAPEKTIAELREVVRLDPNHFEANYKLARLLLNRGRIDETINAIEQMKLTPQSSVPFLNLLGEAYLRKGNPEKAESN